MVEWIQFPSGKRLCRCHYKEVCPSNPTAGISKKVVSKKNHKVSRGINKGSRVVHDIKERFHSYSKRFPAIVDWDLINVEPIMLRNNVSYKRLDFERFFIKVFRDSISIVLRSNCEIKGLPVREALAKSNVIIDEALARLPKSIRVDLGKVSTIHNAFMNHPFASRNVSVSINGEKRFISDNSHGVSEFESINVNHFQSDSEAIENDVISLVDKGLSRDFIAQSILDLVNDREYYADNLREHVSAIREMSFLFKRLSRRLK